MTQAQRRGACPSIDAPMQTGDGLLVRITPARGFFDPDQLLAITRAAQLCGNGTLEVSTRGNLQVRGISNDTVLAFRSRIIDAGIEVASGVPILVSPLAGLDRTEVCDASKLHALLRDQLQDSGLADRLGPKVSVVIDGGGAFDLSRLIADVRLKAIWQKGKARWRLFVGGTEAKSRVLGLAPNDTAAVSAVLALLAAIAKRGATARGRDLDAGDLDAGDLAAAMEFVEAARVEAASGEAAPVEAATIKTLTPAKAVPPIGLLPLKSGVFAAGFGLPFGNTSAAALTKFARAAAQAGANEIRPAPGKIILMPGLSAEAAAELQASAQALGLICDAGDPRLAIVTCAGKPACNSAHIDTRSLATLLASEVGSHLVGDPLVGNPLVGDQLVGDPLVGRHIIHISGCDKLCANPGNPDLEIIGSAEGFKITGAGCAKSCASREEALRVIAQALSDNKVPSDNTTSAPDGTANPTRENLRT